jgi:thymidylate synthase (FAD)
MQVKLVNITPDAEKFISYVARVSNPDNQDNPEYAKLIKYLIKHKHWSPFEHSFATFEIKTSRAIAAQILRHRSFSFQEFSQRYSTVTEFEPVELRKQAEKNRQSSEEVFNPTLFDLLIKDGANPNYRAQDEIKNVLDYVIAVYKRLIAAGVAKESARFILPLMTQTTLYMSGSMRSWIHYVQLRDKDDVQKEHRLIAREIKETLRLHLPDTFTALAMLDKEEQDKELLYKLLLDGTIQLPL